MKKRKILVGAIRWDAWYGHDGKADSVITQVERTLSPAHYHFRAPFFARVTEENTIEIPEYTQEIFDREMEYAIDAGIDYFTYVWYNDDMKKAREMFAKSRYRGQVKMSLCLGGAESSKNAGIIELFKQDWYQTVCGGRPLVHYFSAFAGAKKSIEDLTCLCREAGIPKPYFIVMNLGTEDTAASGADAIGQYGVAASGGVPFSALREGARSLWKRFHEGEMPYLVTVGAGWHSVPRYENPVSWLKVGADSWCEYPTGQDLEEHLTEAFDYMNRPEVIPRTPTGCVQIYAWNEHDEGGWICPTIEVDAQGKQVFDAEGKPLVNTERLSGIRRAIKKYREEET